jgi:gluconate 2-dehydrogenase gamma chain
MAQEPIERRNFLKGAGVIGGVAAAGLAGSAPLAPAAAAESAAPAPSNSPPAGVARLVLTPSEEAFLTAAVDTLIPADDQTPAGSDCGVVTFIDRQLAGAYGAGAKMYRGGPFLKGRAEHGYQLALTPRDFFAVGIAAANDWARATYGKDFDRLAPEQREEALIKMEEGKTEFSDFNARLFFDALLNLAMDGFFADPKYGGNRDKIAWKMLGFPGLPAYYADKIEQYRGKRYEAEPQSIADFS